MGPLSGGPQYSMFAVEKVYAPCFSCFILSSMSHVKFKIRLCRKFAITLCCEKLMKMCYI